MLHGLCCGEEAGARNLVFFRVKWLQATMKGTCTSCVRRVRFGSFRVQSVPPMGFATSGCSCVRSSMRFLTLWWQIALEWLHECCMGYVVGRKPEHETLCFSVKWLQATMKGTSCVRRVRFGSFRVQSVPPMGFATSGCSCVRSSMRFLTLCGGRSHWNGCMNVAWAMLWGGSRSTKPCIFPCKVAAAGDERYLVCAAVAVWIVSSSIGSSYGFCNEWLFLCA